jgi:hypothetical protein
MIPPGIFPTGVVNVYVAGNLTCSKPVGGSLACPVAPILVDDEYPAYASYAGDVNFIPVTSPVAIVSIIPAALLGQRHHAVHASAGQRVPGDVRALCLRLQQADHQRRRHHQPEPAGQSHQVDELLVESNAALTSLNGLGNIKRIRNQVRIQNNPLLASVGLGALTRAGELTVDSNAVLTSLAGLSSLPATTNQVRIQNNPALTTSD